MRVLRYEAGLVTHPGNQRQVNQDSLLLRRGSVDGREFLLLAVADGMGGMAQGEQASGLATQKLNQWWQQQLPELICAKLDWSQLEASLRAVIDDINWTLYRGAQEGVQAGTTLTALFVYRGEYRVFQVGDSRAYLLRGGVLKQLTRDQTWCQREIQAGRLTPAEAAEHSMRHVLVSTLGITEDYTLECLAGKLGNGDGLLLCSDGFYQELPGDWPGPASGKHPVQGLLENACGRILQGNAEDNLSAILVRMTKHWG